MTRKAVAAAIILFFLSCDSRAVSQTIATAPIPPGIPNPAIPTGFWTRPAINVPLCAVPPKIDGDLSDECWRTAAHNAGFYRWNSSEPVREQTEVWITSDQKKFYLAFHCLDSSPQLIRENETQRDGTVDNDDYIEIDLDSQGTHRSFSVFRVTARGVQAASLEGGTADNITWAGDWKATARRTSDGWTAEIAIPFALLRYQRNATSLYMNFWRKMAREDSYTFWPYIPPAGQADSEVLYLSQFRGLHLPYYPPHPIFLPYVLARAGEDNAVHAGLDVKYPLTTTLVGVATIKPDFETVEQTVTNINFSYTEKYVDDRRPFFAEGSGFLPARDIFYSRRIESLDTGFKLVGKEGPTTIGGLFTNAGGRAGGRNLVLNLGRDIGDLSGVGADIVTSNMRGEPSGDDMRLYGNYGYKMGKRRLSFNGYATGSWQQGRWQGASNYAQASFNNNRGHPGVSVDYISISPDFLSPLGYVPELDLRGPSINISQSNSFDVGAIEDYSASVYSNRYEHFSGSLYRTSMGYNSSVDLRSGLGFSYSSDWTLRERAIHDHVDSVGIGWGNKTLFQRGSVNDSFGHLDNQSYNYLSVSQGLLLARLISMQANWNQLLLGGSRTTQTVVTGTYRMDSYHAMGIRLVQQGSDVDLFYSYAAKPRSGVDLYLLLGDPNSPRTQGNLTAKVVRPF